MIPSVLTTSLISSTPITEAGLAGFTTIPGVVYAEPTNTASPAGSPATIKTYTLPAGALVAPSPNGAARGLRIRAWGKVANNANAKTVNVQFAGTAIGIIAITTSIANNWAIDCHVLVKTPTVVTAYGTCFQGNGTPSNTILDTGIASGFDISQPIVLSVVAATQTSAGDINCEGFVIEVF